ncbi:MAG: LysE family transporter [Proteobacteria bacterium]|nr:LysE family transporter [Pseudomonadota bacterium]
MPLLTFMSEAVFISLSGVMAPGPVTAVTIGKGNESPHAGALVAIGHGVIEIPLMISILYGFGYLLSLSYAKIVISFAGGLFLFFMGIGMFRNIRYVQTSSKMYAHSPMVAGILLSLGNPYFLIWWATIGAALILRSIGFGILAFIIFVLLHWLCDFLWYYFLSALSFKGGQFFGKRFQKTVFAICGLILLFFSGKFVIDALRLFFV